MAFRTAAFAALGLLAASMGGCAHEKVADNGYRWAYLEAGQEPARLAYGLPDTDSVALMMSCRPDKDGIDVTAVGLPGDTIVLASGGAESRLPAAKIDDELNDGGTLQAQAKADAPALAGFRRSGELALLTKGERHDLAAGSADRGKVRAFFTACGV